MVLRNEQYKIVVRQTCHDIVWPSSETLEKFIRELHGVATHVNIAPNSLGRVDKHKVSISHRQLHPSMIGIIDLMDSTKDVGQTGTISPWADITVLSEFDINKYPNIKYDLFNFIRERFPVALQFNCKNITEYNNILDRLVMSTRIDLDYKIFGPTISEDGVIQG